MFHFWNCICHGSAWVCHSWPKACLLHITVINRVATPAVPSSTLHGPLTRSVPPGFLMICIDSRFWLPLSLSTASTAKLAKWSLSCSQGMVILRC